MIDGAGGPSGPYTRGPDSLVGSSMIVPDTYAVQTTPATRARAAGLRAHATPTPAFYVDYTALGAAKRWQDIAELYWQFIGDETAKPADSASITVHLPDGRDQGRGAGLDARPPVGQRHHPAGRHGGQRGLPPAGVHVRRAAHPVPRRGPQQGRARGGAAAPGGAGRGEGAGGRGQPLAHVGARQGRAVGHPGLRRARRGPGPRRPPVGQVRARAQAAVPGGVPARHPAAAAAARPRRLHLAHGQRVARGRHRHAARPRQPRRRRDRARADGGGRASSATARRSATGSRGSATRRAAAGGLGGGPPRPGVRRHGRRRQLRA